MQQRFATGATALRSWLDDAHRLLANHSDRLNAINVFPVPDGDTGTNLYLTLAALRERAPGEGEDDLGAVVAAAALACLNGARGNSGTLVAFFLKGFAEPLHGARRLTPSLLAAALDHGRVRSYSALTDPVEGTMLTAMSAAAAHAADFADGHPEDDSNAAVVECMEGLIQAVAARVDGSRHELAALEDAGVVDAGAVGFLLLMSGLHAAVAGRHIDEERLETLAGYGIQEPAVHWRAVPADGVEVMCSIELDALGAATLRARLDGIGDSVVMGPIEESGESYRWRVHVHVEDEDRALGVLTEFGRPEDVTVTPLHHGGPGAGVEPRG